MIMTAMPKTDAFQKYLIMILEHPCWSNLTQTPHTNPIAWALGQALSHQPSSRIDNDDDRDNDDADNTANMLQLQAWHCIMPATSLDHVIPNTPNNPNVVTTPIPLPPSNSFPPMTRAATNNSNHPAANPHITPWLPWTQHSMLHPIPLTTAWTQHKLKSQLKPTPDPTTECNNQLYQATVKTQQSKFVYQSSSKFAWTNHLSTKNGSGTCLHLTSKLSSAFKTFICFLSNNFCLLQHKNEQCGLA